MSSHFNSISLSLLLLLLLSLLLKLIIKSDSPCIELIIDSITFSETFLETSTFLWIELFMFPCLEAVLRTTGYSLTLRLLCVFNLEECGNEILLTLNIERVIFIKDIAKRLRSLLPLLLTF